MLTNQEHELVKQLEMAIFGSQRAVFGELFGLRFWVGDSGVEIVVGAPPGITREDQERFFVEFGKRMITLQERV